MTMRKPTPMRLAKIGYIAASVLLGAFGVYLTVNPSVCVRVAGRVLGVLFILFGMAKLGGFFSKDLYRLAYQYDLAYGVLCIVLGAVLLLRSTELLRFFCATTGLAILADGLFKIQIAADARRFGIRPWWAILCIAALTALSGLLLLLYPAQGTEVLTVFVGISLVCEALLNLCTVLCTVKIVKNQKPDIVDAEFDEP